MTPTPQQILADLARAFPRQAVPRETFAVYLRELDDVPPALLEAAVREMIRTKDFFPTVRELREAVAERALALPGEAAALEQVHARVAWARVDEADRDGDPPAVHPIVLDALAQVGGFAAFRTADEPGVVRGQFLRIFRDMRARAVREAQLGADLLPLGPTQRSLGP